MAFTCLRLLIIPEIMAVLYFITIVIIFINKSLFSTTTSSLWISTIQALTQFRFKWNDGVLILWSIESFPWGILLLAIAHFWVLWWLSDKLSGWILKRLIFFGRLEDAVSWIQVHDAVLSRNWLEVYIENCFQQKHHCDWNWIFYNI